MSDNAKSGPFVDDRDLLASMLDRYAARYFLTGPERTALVSQTITTFAENPEVLLDQPVEKAIATTMDELFRRNASRRDLS